MAQRTERQNRLLEELTNADRPLTGTELAARCNVTRQVVVHDVAIIRASGVQILSTPRGYWLQNGSSRETRVLSVCHPPELTEVELLILVDLGIDILDVMVEHPIYGYLKGGLHLSSRRDVELFMQQVQDSNVTLLSSLTDGFHLHTVAPPHPHRLEEAVKELRANGIQVFEEGD